MARANLGANIRRARSDAGMTQTQLAEAAGIADATVSRIERGRLDPSSSLLGRLAAALNVTPDVLLRGASARSQVERARPAVARLLATVKGMDDGQLDDVTKALKLLIGAARR